MPPSLKVPLPLVAAPPLPRRRGRRAPARRIVLRRRVGVRERPLLACRAGSDELGKEGRERGVRVLGGRAVGASARRKQGESRERREGGTHRGAPPRDVPQEVVRRVASGAGPRPRGAPGGGGGVCGVEAEAEAVLRGGRGSVRRRNRSAGEGGGEGAPRARGETAGVADRAGDLRRFVQGLGSVTRQQTRAQQRLVS